MLWLVLAQAAIPDPVSGGAGWVGAGLLGAVLSWLMFKHLPAKDEQFTKLVASKDQAMRELVDSKDVHVVKITEMFMVRVNKLDEQYEKQVRQMFDDFHHSSQQAREEYKNSLNIIVGHCEREMGMLAQAVHREFEIIGKTIATMNGKPNVS